MPQATSISVLPDQDRYFQALKATLFLSVPAVMLFLLALAIITVASLLAHRWTNNLAHSVISQWHNHVLPVFRRT